MGKKINRLGRGLAAGLVAVGEVEERKKAEKKEEERFQAQSARAERQLRIQEAESAQRQERNKLDISMKRVQWKNQQMMQAAAGSNYDPRVMDKAFSQWGTNSGTTWTYNPQKSAAAGKDVIIYDIGTTTKNSDGTIKPGADGKAEVVALPGSFSEMRFDNQDDHVNFFLRAADPAWALAHDQAEITAAETRANAQRVHDERLKSDPAYALMHGTKEEMAKLGIQEKKVDIRKKTAEAGLAEKKLERGVAEQTTPAQAPVSTFKSATGQQIKQTAKDVEKAKAFAAAINKTAEVPIDADDAARIMHVKNDSKSQQVIAKILDQTETEAEFIDAFGGSLPDSFLQQIYLKADKEGKTIKDTRGFFGRLFNTELKVQ
jgi:hypothetical protein